MMESTKNHLPLRLVVILALSSAACSPGSNQTCGATLDQDALIDAAIGYELERNSRLGQCISYANLVEFRTRNPDCCVADLERSMGGRLVPAETDFGGSVELRYFCTTESGGDVYRRTSYNLNRCGRAIDYYSGELPSD